MLTKLNLSRKMQVLIFSILGIFLAATFVLKYGINNQTQKLIHNGLQNTKSKDLDRILNLNDYVLKSHVIDYSTWDKSVNFVEGKLSKTWADSEYKESLEFYNINYIWIFSADGKILYSVNPESNEVMKQGFIPLDMVKSNLKKDVYYKFYKKQNNKVIEIFCSPITTSYDMNKQGNAKGYLLIGREVDQQYANQLRNISPELNIELIHSNLISERSTLDIIEREKFTFFHPLKDFNNTTIAYLKISKEFETFTVYQKMVNQYLMAFLLFFILIGVVFYILSKKLFLNPFANISKTLFFQNTEYIQPLQNRNDEFSEVSNLIIQFFNQNKELENEIANRYQSEVELIKSTELQQMALDEKNRLEAFFNEQNKILQISSLHESPNDTLKKTIEVTSKTLKCEKVGIWMFNESKKSISNVYAYKLSTETYEMNIEEAFEHEFPNYFRNLKNELSIIADDAQNNELTKELTVDYYQPQGITSIIDIPIKSGNKVIGVLCCEHVGQKRNWSNSEQIFVNSVANFITLQLEREEREKAEDLLIENQLIFEEAQELAKVGSWEFNFVTKEVKCSKEMYRIFEIEYPNNNNLFELFYNKIHKDDKDLIIKGVERFIQSGESNIIECRVKCNDGSIKYIKAIGAVILSKKNKKIIGIKGSLQDITENKLADKAKSDFLSTMSHEIRTPINGVVGIANLLMDEELSTKQREYVNTLNYSAKHLASVVSDILDFSKIESGAMTFEKVSFNLNENCKHIFDLFQSKANENGIRYQYIPTEMNDYSLYGDPIRLNQILSNLVSNAIKFTKKGQVELSYTVLEDTHHDVKVQFKIADTGIGISEESVKVIFESFRQANEKVTRTFGGTGLGLTICKKLVELQNGSIRVESQLGRGTTFYVELRFEKHLYKANKLRSEPIPDLIDKSIENSVNVLIAEDNKINAMVLCRFLDKWKVSYKLAKDGMEVLTKLKSDDFDLILMDIQMPLMDGIEATKLIRSLPDEKLSNINIVAFTADASSDTHKNLLKNGFTHCMTKPFDPDTLFKYLVKIKKQKLGISNEYLQAITKDEVLNKNG